jgi:cytochrome c oxidase cbb3-type subunit III
MIDPAPSGPIPQSTPRRIARRAQICIILLILLASAGGAISLYRHLRREQLGIDLLQAGTTAIVKDARLTAYASAQAKPLYVKNCARCHGADMRGNPALGAPNLIDRVWLYGEGSVFDIERTLLYGVRSGQSKSHDVADMPAFGVTGRLSEAEIRNLVQYLLQLSRRPHQGAAAREGREVYGDVAKANCADCHGDAGQGNPDYGAPDLTADVWNGGGDERSLYDAIYFGQHHIMPGWLGVLSLEQIRALAIYVYLNSHHE